MSRDFKVIDGLQADDFVLTEDRDVRTLCGFVHRREPSSIGILLDTSGSMAGYRFNGLAIATVAINQLLDTSAPQDEYFLAYANDATVQHRFSQDLARIRSGLQVGSKGRTSLVDSIYQSLDAMRQAHHPNRALLVFSDAYDNASRHRPEEIARSLAKSPVPIFLVIPVDPMDRAQPPPPLPPEEIAARENLVRLSASSGGTVTAVSSKRESLTAATQLAAAIRSPYLLYFEAFGSDQGRLGEIRVQVNNVRPRPAVLYRGARRHPEQPRPD